MPGSEELFDRIRLQAKALGNVTFHGAVPYRKVRSLYERARLLVSTSEIEGFPNTYLQAWSHGTPVVGFLDPDGLLEMHGSGRAVRDLEGMCAAIADLSEDGAKWERASARAREYMNRHCGEGKVLAPYVAALAELGGASTGGPSPAEAPVARG